MRLRVGSLDLFKLGFQALSANKSAPFGNTLSGPFGCLTFPKVNKLTAVPKADKTAPRKGKTRLKLLPLHIKYVSSDLFV